MSGYNNKHVLSVHLAKEEGGSVPYRLSSAPLASTTSDPTTNNEV